MKNYYQILGIPPFSTLEQIKSAFRILAKTYHPDISKDDGKKFIEIFEAYEFLSDKSRKEFYDQNLREQGDFDQIKLKSQIFQSFSQDFKKKQNEFRAFDEGKLKLFFRIVSGRIPDLTFSLILTFIGVFLSTITFYSSENLAGGLIGVIVGFPLALVGINDLITVLKINDFKNTSEIFKKNQN